MKDGQKLIIIDTETNDVKNPQLMQIGYILVEVNSTTELGYHTLRELGTLVQVPLDLKINPYSFAVHKLTAERCITYGIPVEGIQGCLWSDISLADVIIMHNVSFDLRVLKNFAGDSSLKDTLETTPTHCTMRGSTKFCKLTNVKGHAKPPKLSELYGILFGEEFEKAHDALGDVRATLRCYMALPSEFQFNELD